jgi:hypothetical protein
MHTFFAEFHQRRRGRYVSKNWRCVTQSYIPSWISEPCAGFRFFTRVSSTHFLICTFAYTPTPRFWYPTFELPYLPTPKNLKQAAKRTYLPRRTCGSVQTVAGSRQAYPPTPRNTYFHWLKEQSSSFYLLHGYLPRIIWRGKKQKLIK